MVQDRTGGPLPRVWFLKSDQAPEQFAAVCTSKTASLSRCLSTPADEQSVALNSARRAHIPSSIEQAFSKKSSSFRRIA
jgi:hypothetical protein